MDVNEWELMVCNKRIFEGESTEGRRWRGGVSYTSQEQTMHVLTLTQLSKSLLWSDTLSIRSGTCVLMELYGGARSS